MSEDLKKFIVKQIMQQLHKKKENETFSKQIEIFTKNLSTKIHYN